jgi:hypothetical protein
LFEEFLGTHATPRPGVVLAANFSWLVMPGLVVLRLARTSHPFAKETS